MRVRRFTVDRLNRLEIVETVNWRLLIESEQILRTKKQKARKCLLMLRISSAEIRNRYEDRSLRETTGDSEIVRKNIAHEDEPGDS